MILLKDSYECAAAVVSSGSGSAQTPVLVPGGNGGVVTGRSESPARPVPVPVRAHASVVTGEEMNVRYADYSAVADVLLCVRGHLIQTGAYAGLERVGLGAGSGRDGGVTVPSERPAKPVLVPTRAPAAVLAGEQMDVSCAEHDVDDNVLSRVP